LTVGGITAADKTYDAGTAATVNTAGASNGGLLAGDVVTVSATGLFDDKNVGAGKTVTRQLWRRRCGQLHHHRPGRHHGHDHPGGVDHQRHYGGRQDL
jgi:hypothetical protein